MLFVFTTLGDAKLNPAKLFPEDYVDSRQHELQLPTGKPTDEFDELLLIDSDQQ
jgi:hypothetical protein